MPCKRAGLRVNVNVDDWSCPVLSCPTQPSWSQVQRLTATASPGGYLWTGHGRRVEWGADCGPVDCGSFPSVSLAVVQPCPSVGRRDDFGANKRGAVCCRCCREMVVTIWGCCLPLASCPTAKVQYHVCISPSSRLTVTMYTQRSIRSALPVLWLDPWLPVIPSLPIPSRRRSAANAAKGRCTKCEIPSCDAGTPALRSWPHFPRGLSRSGTLGAGAGPGWAMCLLQHRGSGRVHTLHPGRASARQRNGVAFDDLPALGFATLTNSKLDGLLSIPSIFPTAVDVVCGPGPDAVQDCGRLPWLDLETDASGRCEARVMVWPGPFGAPQSRTLGALPDRPHAAALGQSSRWGLDTVLLGSAR